MLQIFGISNIFWKIPYSWIYFGTLYCNRNFWTPCIARTQIYFGTPCTGINSEALCNLTCSSSCSSWSRNWSPSWSSSTWSRLLFWSATWSRFSSCSSIFRPRSCSGSTISGSPRFPNLRKFLRTRVVYLDNITSSINYSSVYSYVNNNISPNQGRVSRLNNIVFKLLLYVSNNISYYRRNSALTGN